MWCNEGLAPEGLGRGRGGRAVGGQGSLTRDRRRRHRGRRRPRPARRAAATRRRGRGLAAAGALALRPGGVAAAEVHGGAAGARRLPGRDEAGGDSRRLPPAAAPCAAPRPTRRARPARRPLAARHARLLRRVARRRPAALTRPPALRRRLRRVAGQLPRQRLLAEPPGRHPAAGRLLELQVGQSLPARVHEQGMLDLPVMLDEVHRHARAPVTVVAHSLGAAALLALLAERPRHGARLVRHAVLLGAVASLRGLRAKGLRPLAHYVPLLGQLLQLVGNGRLMALGVVSARLLSLLCSPGAPTAGLCKQAVFAVAGRSSELFDAALLSQIIMQHTSGTSVKSLVHLSDCLLAEAFVKPRESGERRAAEYNLTAIDVPLTFVYARNDHISGPQETAWLSKKTRNVSTVYEVPHPTFNHLDFLYGTEAKRLLHDAVVSQVEERVARSLAATGRPPTDTVGTLPDDGSDQDDDGDHLDGDD